MANYFVFKVSEEEVYKLRIKSRQAAKLEIDLGESPLMAIMRAQSVLEGKENPSIEEIMACIPKVAWFAVVLHASLQAFHHGISKDDVYDILDRFLENGGSYYELLEVVMEVLMVSNYMPSEAPEAE